MNPTISQAILLAVAVLAVLFLVHRFAPTSAVAKAEDVAIAQVKKVEPILQNDAMQALSAVETWLTDTSSEDATIAKANASKATKAAALREHISTLQAKLPAA